MITISFIFNIFALKLGYFIVKLQAKSLDLELTLFYPCHNKNKKKNKKKNPPPKSIRRGSARRLKFDTLEFEILAPAGGMLATLKFFDTHTDKHTC